MKLRLLDAIESWEPHRAIRGRKVVSFEEYMLRRPLGRAEELPESLVLGSMIELAAWLAILSSDFTQMALPCEVGEVRFVSALGPGQRLSLQLTVCPGDHGQIIADGRGRVADRPVLEVADLRMCLRPLTEYHNPDDLRVLFSEIHRPMAEAAV